MGFLGRGESMAKGVVTRALDHISVGHRARRNMENLRVEILKIRTEITDKKEVILVDFPGLEEVFHDHLFPHLLDERFDTAAPVKQSDYRDQLRDFWFGDNAKLYEGKSFKMRAIYGQGILNTLNVSLEGKPDPIPIDSYWIAIHNTVEMIVLKRTRQVTLLVCTPWPDAGGMGTDTNPRAACEAWGTRWLTGPVGYEVDPTEIDADGNQLGGITGNTHGRVTTYKCVGGPTTD